MTVKTSQPSCLVSWNFHGQHRNSKVCVTPDFQGHTFFSFFCAIYSFSVHGFISVFLVSFEFRLLTDDISCLWFCEIYRHVLQHFGHSFQSSKMTSKKHFVSDIACILDNISNTDFKYIEDSCSKTHKNFSDSSVDNDESEDSFSIQNIWQWWKTDAQNIPPAPASFSFHGNTISHYGKWCDCFELFFILFIFLSLWCYITDNSTRNQQIRWSPKKRLRCKKWTDMNEKELRLFLSVLFPPKDCKKTKLFFNK